VPEGDRTPEISEIYQIADRWAEIRLYSDEEAKQKLSGEELEAYERYHAKVKEDIEKAQDLAMRMAKAVEIPQVAKKSKTQRKKDAWAKKQARAAADAAAV
jgi:Fe2+ transport system protein B